MNDSEMNFDALIPAQMAAKAEAIGIRKANSPALTLFVLAVLAGAFVAIGAIFATLMYTGTAAGVPFAVTRLLMGLVFSVGLILVVVGGAELFTGNNLIVIAWANRKVSMAALARNWLIVYLGNFVGSVATALLVVLGHHYGLGGGAVGKAMLAIAAGKMGYTFTQALTLGILCNALVCLAVWLTYSARSTTDKIMAIIFPISAFVAAGFEHSVANMYFIPVALLVKAIDPAFTAASGVAVDALTLGNFFLNNLLPVTIGNIIGGTVMVGLVYWLVYLYRK